MSPHIKQKKNLDIKKKIHHQKKKVRLRMKVVMKKYHERILILKEQLMQSGDTGNNYHKVMSYLEILDKYGYRPD